MCNLIVTGHRGFIGRHIVQVAIEKWGASIAFLPKGMDITKPLDDIQVELDTVIHCAALSTVSGYGKDALYKTNVTGTKNVLKAALKVNPNIHFIFLSSATVYAPSQGVRTEESPLGPISDYGKSKLEAEQWLLDQQQKYGFRLHIVRPVAVVGRYMTHGLVKAVVDKINAGENPVQLLGTEETQSVKQFVHIDDLLFAFEDLVYKGGDEAIHNVTPYGGPISVQQVFEAVRDVFKLDVDMEFSGPTWEGDDTYVHLKARRYEGWTSSLKAVQYASLEYGYFKYLEKMVMST